MDLPDPRPVEPLARPPHASVRVPGSKSITNRALVAAALADGTSNLSGALFADDTAAMADCLTRLRAQVVADPAAASLTVTGIGLDLPDSAVVLDARLSGTTSRFVLPLLALGHGHYTLDGDQPLRERPMGGSLDALRELGAHVEELAAPGHLPVTVSGGPVPGGIVWVSGDTSSQFLSGLLLAAPAMRDGLRIELTTELVSRPYVDLTIATMADFGVTVAQPDDATFVVREQRYRPRELAVEPDASAASYFFAAAAITGGTVQVAGLGPDSRQGDLAFVDVLGSMGATVDRRADGIVVTGPPPGGLRGGVVDMAHISDTAQTLAAVAVFADRPTQVTGIGFIRGKETDRIAAVVAELRRCGIEATEDRDGFTVHPGTPRPATVQTYRDHRMAMSFALLGLRAPGIAIADPGCVAKTFPSFFEVLDQLRVGAPAG